MKWIPFEEFQYEIPPRLTKEDTNWNIKNNVVAVKKLHDKFESGKEWLLSPLEDKIIKHKTANELRYILFWAWQQKIYLNKEYNQYLYDYLCVRYSDAGTAKVIKDWLINHNLINPKELDEIGKRKVIKGVVFLSLFLMKPFSEITDEGLDKTPLIYEKPYSKKSVNDLRIMFGYTNKIVKRDSFSKRSNWKNKLFPHPLWGQMFKDYYDYLIRAGAKKHYISTVGSSLCILLDYLDSESLPDCSHFTWSDFKKLTEYINNTSLSENKKRLVSTTTIVIAKLKKFFLWGVNENAFFPKELDFPESYWKSLNKEAKEHSKTSDGRAFKQDGTADEIVKILIEYKPENEIEQLCLYFWSIITSCPARFSYVLNIEIDCLKKLPNEPNAFGLYSINKDKAGTKGGQFPFVDELGINAVIALQKRAKIANFKPLFNDDYKREYVHLFQLAKPPWILDESTIWSFFNNKIKPKVTFQLELEESFVGGAHGFRHHILTEILKRTGSMEAAQVAAGHLDPSMTNSYIKSKHAKKALLYRALEKYEGGEITGKFYLRLIEALTTNEPTSELIKDLTKEMTMEAFIQKHGRKTEMGLCFDEDGTCSNYLKCWNCPSFLLKREEIEGAVNFLKRLTLEFIDLKKNSKDFSYDNPIAQNKMTSIALIKERLIDLKITEDEIVSMIFDIKTNEVLK